MIEYRVVAHNTATASANKIHDDGVARRYGFRGGLVPGVDVYAYMTHPPAEAWGLDWLHHGSMRARFLGPVYDGDAVTVVPGEVVGSPDGPVVTLQLRNDAGVVCAIGEAALLAAADEHPSAQWPEAEPAGDPPAASPAALTPGTVLGLGPHRFHADRADEYLDAIRERLPLYADAKVAHPGWLLRDANYVLSTNVVLGPWIHVESATRHHGLVHDGAVVDGRARVIREWERKGHRFVELDVGLFAGAEDADHLVAQVAHTAIYQPRGGPT